MTTKLSRREWLKLAGAGALGLALGRPKRQEQECPHGRGSDCWECGQDWLEAIYEDVGSGFEILLTALCDPENQPHQWMGDRDALRAAWEERSYPSAGSVAYVDASGHTCPLEHYPVYDPITGYAGDHCPGPEFWEEDGSVLAWNCSPGEEFSPSELVYLVIGTAEVTATPTTVSVGQFVERIRDDLVVVRMWPIQRGPRHG